jgi:hypothetical protein
MTICLSAAPQVLKLLQESTGNILDDEVLINVLNNSKSTSGESSAKNIHGLVCDTVCKRFGVSCCVAVRYSHLLQDITLPHGLRGACLH